MTTLQVARDRLEEYVRAEIHEAMRPAADRPQWEPEIDSAHGPVYLRRLFQEIVEAARRETVF